MPGCHALNWTWSLNMPRKRPSRRPQASHESGSSPRARALVHSPWRNGSERLGQWPARLMRWWPRCALPRSPQPKLGWSLPSGCCVAGYQTRRRHSPTSRQADDADSTMRARVRTRGAQLTWPQVAHHRTTKKQKEERKNHLKCSALFAFSVLYLLNKLVVLVTTWECIYLYTLRKHANHFANSIWEWPLRMAFR